MEAITHDCAHVSFGRHRFSDIRDIVLGGHMLDDIAERLPYFLRRGFLRSHMKAIVPYSPDGT